MSMAGICDLHTHVLPGVDDGAPDIACAVQMLRNAVASDVAYLVATPHWDGTHGSLQQLRQRFSQLQQAAGDIDVQLALGAEVRVTEHLPSLLAEKAVPTLNESRYLLTEFSPNVDASAFPDALQGILDQGYIPLIAHPERYAAVCAHPQIVKQWLDMGCHLQLTGGSIRGDYGKTIWKTAEYMLQRDYVACVASDAHGTERRSNFLLDVYDHLSIRYSKQYARCLMYTNPMCICQGQSL